MAENFYMAENNREKDEIRRRPTSVAIIGIASIVIGCLCFFALLFFWFMANEPKTPFLTLLELSIWGAVQITVGIGLLKLKKWAWYSTIGLSSLYIFYSKGADLTEFLSVILGIIAFIFLIGREVRLAFGFESKK